MISDDSFDVPPLVLLGYDDQRPHLRILRLPEQEIETVAGSLESIDFAISDLIPRATWIGIGGQDELWSAPIPMDGVASLLVRGVDRVAAEHPDHMWVTLVGDGSPGFAEIDGTGIVHRSLPAGVDERIDACTPHGLVVRAMEAEDGSVPNSLTLRDPDSGFERDLGPFDLGPFAWILASHGSILVALTPVPGAPLAADLVLVDVASGNRVRIQNPGIGQWQTFPSFSPDGSMVAIGAHLRAPGADTWDPLGGGVFPPPYVPSASALVLVDTATGAANVVEGQFDNFAWTPCWSRDGEWIVFGAPFEEGVLYFVRVGKNRLHRLEFDREPPMPMLDITNTGFLL